MHSALARLILVILLACQGGGDATLVADATAGDPHAFDASGCTALMQAARNGDVAAIAALVRRGADPNARDRGPNGWTPLLHAIHRNQGAAVAALLAVGADPNAATARGHTPLMMASLYGRAGIVRLLLAHHANPRAVNWEGATALDLALEGSLDLDRFTLFD